MRFFRVLALHYISCAKHTFGEKKRLRASKKNGVDANEETLERGRRKASRVPRRAMPSFARLFFSVMVVVLLAKRRYAFLCGVRKLNAKKKLFWDKKRRRRRKGRRRKKERKAKERPDDFIIIVVVVVVVVPVTLFATTTTTTLELLWYEYASHTKKSTTTNSLSTGSYTPCT